MAFHVFGLTHLPLAFALGFPICDDVIMPSYVPNIIASSKKVTPEKEVWESGSRKYVIPAQRGEAAGMWRRGAGILGPVPRANRQKIQCSVKYQSIVTPPKQDIMPNFQTPPHWN